MESVKTHGANTGVCKFCGQVITIGAVKALAGRELADPDYWATRYCSCREAQEFTKREVQREQEEERRKSALREALKLIEDKLGAAAAEAFQGRAMYELDRQVRALCYEGAVLVYDGIVNSLSVTAVDGSAIKIWLDEKARRIEVRRRLGLEL